MGVVKDEPSQGRDDYLEAVSPERSLPADEPFSDAEQEEEGEEEEEEEVQEDEEARTEGSVPEEEEDEEEEDEGEDEEEEMEEGRGVLAWEWDNPPSQMDTRNPVLPVFGLWVRFVGRRFGERFRLGLSNT